MSKKVSRTIALENDFIVDFAESLPQETTKGDVFRVVRNLQIDASKNNIVINNWGHVYWEIIKIMRTFRRY